MSVLDEMLDIRERLVNEDRHKAMEALVRLLHYRIAPLVVSGDTFTLFPNEEAAAKFSAENGLDRRAVDWLFEAMRDENLLTLGKASVTLMPLGVEKLCV
ncbi:MAG: hypothetical protein IJR14_07640 [Synergistaceae bacterium]|nr:hypothetical protein [Synergistaceae bacterium]